MLMHLYECSSTPACSIRASQSYHVPLLILPGK